MILGSAFGIATAANFANHRGYWEGTIRRVQTTDFNILSHTIPMKISYALIQNNQSEIQRTLNSNYGLFGLVVTNCTQTNWQCPEQKVLYITESNRSWREKLTLKSLQQHPFDLLRDPPPVLTEGGYENSRAQTWQLTGQRNTGNVIGRIYYIRGIPPKFSETYARWLLQLPGSLLSDSGANKYYTLTLVAFMAGGAASWLLIEWILQRRRILQHNLDEVQRQFEQVQEDLRNQLRQINQRIKERSAYIQQLEVYREEQDDSIHQLKQTITQLESQLANPSRVIRSEILEQSQASLESEIQQREAMIKLLKQQLTEQEQSSSHGQHLVVQLNQQLHALNQQLNQSQAAMLGLSEQMELKEQEREVRYSQLEADSQKCQMAITELKETIALQEQSATQAEHSVVQLNEQLAVAFNQLKDSQQSREILQQQIEAQEIEAEEMQRLVEQLRHDIQATQRREARAQQQCENLQAAMEILKQEKEDVEAQLGSPRSNEFERQLVTCLAQTRNTITGQWLIRSNKDVKRNGGRRQVVDCLVFARSCVVVIEAKNYKGRIEADGDATTTPWFQVQDGKYIEIKSCYGCNPYEQVSRYTESVMSKLSSVVEKKWVKVYSMVVFPDHANLIAISSEIDDAYSRVVRLDEVPAILKKLEDKAMNTPKARKNPLSAQQIEDIFLGRSARHDRRI
jgi:Nuclease-related domain